VKKDYYKILGVEKNASKEDVKKARSEAYTDKNYRTDKVKYNLNSVDGTITIPTKLSNIGANQFSKSKYLIVMSGKDINFNIEDLTSGNPSPTEMNACIPYGSLNPSSYAPAVIGPCQAMYEIGATETVKGIDLASFLSLNLTSASGCTIGYDCIKEKWKFPASKEFIINITSLSIANSNPNAQLKQFSYTFPSNSAGPPKNINVFVRQFNDYILTDDGIKIPVNIRITIW